MRPARAPGRATGSSRQQGRALGVRVLTVVAARRLSLWPMADDVARGGIGRYARPTVPLALGMCR